MKSIGRLIRGELFKMWKSKILLIMTVILVVVIGIMSAIYSRYDKQVSGLLSMVLGGDQRITSFDLLDGNAQDLLDQAGIDPDSMGLGGAGGFEDAFNQIQSNPNIKAMLVATNPAILIAMEKWTQMTGSGESTSSAMIDDMIRAGLNINPANLQALQAQFGMYGKFANLQGLIAEDYLTDYISQDRAMNDRVSELLTYLQNNGEYGNTVVDFINLQIEKFYNDYKALVLATQAYNQAVDNSTVAVQKEKWENVLKAYYYVATDYSSVKYFTQVGALSTNFLLISTGSSLMAYKQFQNSLAPFESASYKDAITNYTKVLKTKSDTDVWGQFKEEFYHLLDSTYTQQDLPESSYALPDASTKNAAYAFLTSVNSLLSTIEGSNDSIFAFESSDITAVFEKVARGETLLTAEQKLYDNFKLEDGTIDPLLPAHKVMSSSISGVITEKIYDEQIKTFYDEKEKPLIEESAKKLEAVQTSYSDAQLMYGLLGADAFPNGMSSGEYETFYSEYRAGYSEHASRTATAKNLIVNVNLYESIEAAGLNDNEAKKIQGFMLSSRYNLRSEVTKAQYLISTDHLASEYVAPETLGGGWGMMQFVFELSSVIILVFGIVLGAGAIAGEHTNGTMKLLLIRPHRRWQVLISKFIAIVIVMVGFYLINYLLTFCIGAIGWGLTSLPALSIMNSTSAFVMNPFSVLLLQHFFSLIETIIFAQIALTLSTVIKSRSGAVAVSMLIYFVSFILSMLLSSFAWYKFIIFNNTDLGQYLTSMGPSLADMTLGFSIIVNIAYIIAFTVIGLWTFSKRDAT